METAIRTAPAPPGAHTISPAARLHDDLTKAGVLVDSVSIGTRGDATTVTVHPASQQAAAQPIINAFDWSDQAAAIWQQGVNRATTQAHVPSQGGGPQGMAMRGVLKYLLHELNIVRASQPILIESMLRQSTTVTVVTRWPHGLPEGAQVLIHGLNQSPYNGPKTIALIAPLGIPAGKDVGRTFYFEQTGNPPQPADGTGMVFYPVKTTGLAPLDYNQALLDVQTIIDTGGAD
jgi:hypothetical protein